jgi:hypothetical protein
MDKRKESGRNLPTTRRKNSLNRRNRELKLITRSAIPMD